VLNNSVELAPGTSYTYFVINSAANNAVVQHFLLTNDYSRTLPETSRVQATNLVPGSPKLSIYAGDEIVGTNVGYGTASAYRAVDPGVFTVTLSFDGQPSPVLVVPNFLIEERDTLNLVVTGVLTGSPALAIMPVEGIHYGGDGRLRAKRR